MAWFGRGLLRSWLLLPDSGCMSVKRHLFSSEILGVENFKRIRIFENDRLPNKTGFVERLSASCSGAEAQDRRVVADLVKLIYVADNAEEVSLATVLLKQLYCSEARDRECSAAPETQSEKFKAEGPMSPKRFQFGPLIFRLLYILKDLETALSLHTDKDMNWLFWSTSCHLVLMDMLYEQGRYQQVVDTFVAFQHSGMSVRFTPDCTTLAVAALYQLNSAESFQEMKCLVEEAKAEGSTLSRRCLLFAAALALRQGEAFCALNIAQSLINSNEPIFKNIKLMALAQMGRLEEVLMSLEERGKDTSPASLRSGVLYSDTVQRVTDQFAACGKSEPQLKLKLLLTSLETEGLLSPQTVEHFVSRPILRQRKAKSSQSFKTRVKSPVKIK